MNNRLHDDWESLFGRLPVDTTPREDHREQLRTDVLGAYDDQPTPRLQRRGLKEIGRMIMKSKAPYWTAAAAVVACVIWLAQTGGTAAFAIDEVVENLIQARSARYEMTATIVGQPTLRMKAFYLEPNHFRQELENGHINIADWQAGKMVGLDPQSKQATVFNLINVPAEAKSKMKTNQFDAIRESLRVAVADPLTTVESLGEKEMDGRVVVGFRFKTASQPMTLWADPKTRLPVRIESTMVGPPETKVVMTNYEFNVDFDESLFSVAVPAGYKVVETDVDASPVTEQDFVAALKVCSESTGELPAGFDAVAVAKYVATYLQKKGVSQEDGPNAEQMQDVLRIGRGFQFALTLSPDADAHYAGAGAELGAADRAIFWYKPADSAVYRVIHADFSVREAEAAPEVTGAKKLTR